MSGGSFRLFTFPVLAGVFLGLKAALAITLLNGADIFSLAWFVFPGKPLEREFLRSFS